MEFNELIEMRRSVRQYTPSEMSELEMTAIIADALNAPSWNNTEVTRYYAAITDGAKNRIWKEALPSYNVASSAHAAALVAVTFKKGESGCLGGSSVNELGEMWGAYDAGIASSYFILAAQNRGWDSLILGIRDAGKVKQILQIPDGETLTSVIAVGRAAQPASKVTRKSIEVVLHVS